MFGLTILGNHSALPAFNRHPTAQALTYDGQVFLIDCGEGTQFQIARYKVRRSRINHIFISHLHGDHYFGLVGLITSMALTGRHAPLHVYAPEGLEEIIRLQIGVAAAYFTYELHFHLHPEVGGILYNDGKIEVRCFPVQHRIPCCGFVFSELRKPRKINTVAVQQYAIPTTAFAALQSGENYTLPNGTTIANEQLTLPNPKARSYAYAADTIYDPNITKHFTGAIYCTTKHFCNQPCKSRPTLSCHCPAGCLDSKTGPGCKIMIAHQPVPKQDGIVEEERKCLK